MTPEHEPTVTVGLYEIYSLLQEVRFEVKGMSQKVEELSKDSHDHETRLRNLEKDAGLSERVDTVAESVATVSTRLSAVEKKVWAWGGSAVVLASLASYFLPKLIG